MEKDNIMAELKTALNVALLKHKDMNAVAADKSKMVFAFGILIVAALANGLGLRFFGSFFSPSWGMVLSMALYQVISAVIGIYVLSIVAKSIFKGQAKHDAFFRVMAFGMIVSWLSIIPALSIVGGIWALVIVFTVLKVIHKLTTGGAIGSLLVTIVVMAIVGMLIAPILGGLGIGGYGFGGMNLKGGSVGGINDNGFNMNVKTEDGEGSVKMENGKMTIEGPDGKKMEINIPGYGE